MKAGLKGVSVLIISRGTTPLECFLLYFSISRAKKANKESQKLLLLERSSNRNDELPLMIRLGDKVQLLIVIDTKMTIGLIFVLKIYLLKL
jgi:hypothetical protein